MKYTAQNIMVRPFDKQKLSEYFQKFIPFNKGEEFAIDKDSLFLNSSKPMIIDNECCAGYLQKNINKNNSQNEWCVNLGIRKWRESPEGRSLKMEHESYLPVYESEWDNLLLPEVSLEEFMDKRFNYNPRIAANTNAVVRAINKNALDL